jgi:hypothetical protein
VTSQLEYAKDRTTFDRPTHDECETSQARVARSSALGNWEPWSDYVDVSGSLKA